jgi:dihydrofolate reductase
LETIDRGGTVRELRVDLFSTVDGFGGPGPRPTAYWGYEGPDLFGWIAEQTAEEHITLMGATTYRQLAEIHERDGVPSPLGELPKIVFSKTLSPPLSWANTTVISEPAESAVPVLKAEDDIPMRTIGSPSLVRSLFRLGLVDRVRIILFPMIHGVLGEGPVFAELPDLELDLVGSTVLDKRLVLLDYRIEKIDQTGTASIA